MASGRMIFTQLDSFLHMNRILHKADFVENNINWKEKGDDS